MDCPDSVPSGSTAPPPVAPAIPTSGVASCAANATILERLAPKNSDRRRGRRARAREDLQREGGHASPGSPSDRARTNCGTRKAIDRPTITRSQRPVPWLLLPRMALRFSAIAHRRVGCTIHANQADSDPSHDELSVRRASRATSREAGVSATPHQQQRISLLAMMGLATPDALTARTP